MTSITMRVLILLLALAAPAAAAAKPGLTWVSATEGYFTMPLGSQVRYPDNNKTVDTDAWGFGLRAVGNGEGVSRTAGLLYQKNIYDTAPGGFILTLYYTFEGFLEAGQVKQ